MVMPGDEVDRRTDRRHRRDGAETDRSRSDDADPMLRSDPTAAYAVHSHRKRLDETCIPRLESGRQRDDRAFGYDAHVGHPTVAADPQDHSRTANALVVVAVQTRLASAARVDRLDGHGRAVIEMAGELVPQGDRHPEQRHQMQVRSADPGTGNTHPDPGPGRCRDVDDGCGLLDAPHGPHGAILNLSGSGRAIAGADSDKFSGVGLHAKVGRMGAWPDRCALCRSRWSPSGR